MVFHHCCCRCRWRCSCPNFYLQQDDVVQFDCFSTYICIFASLLAGARRGAAGLNGWVIIVTWLTWSPNRWYSYRIWPRMLSAVTSDPTYHKVVREEQIRCKSKEKIETTWQEGKQQQYEIRASKKGKLIRDAILLSLTSIRAARCFLVCTWRVLSSTILSHVSSVSWKANGE